MTWDEFMVVYNDNGLLYAKLIIHEVDDLDLLLVAWECPELLPYIK